MKDGSENALEILLDSNFKNSISEQKHHIVLQRCFYLRPLHDSLQHLHLRCWKKNKFNLLNAAAVVHSQGRCSVKHSLLPISFGNI